MIYRRYVPSWLVAVCRTHLSNYKNSGGDRQTIYVQRNANDDL